MFSIGPIASARSRIVVSPQLDRALSEGSVSNPNGAPLGLLNRDQL